MATQHCSTSTVMSIAETGYADNSNAYQPVAVYRPIIEFPRRCGSCAFLNADGTGNEIIRGAQGHRNHAKVYSIYADGAAGEKPVGWLMTNTH